MKILYQNNDFVVIVKPVGLDSEKDVPKKLKELFSKDIYTLHRLDKNVGGVMVYARNKKTASLISKEISDGRMVKEYLARIHGVPEEKGEWTDFLFKDSTKNKVYVVKRERKGVKKAKLEYTRLDTDGETSLVRVRLFTGRTHQIRVQFSSRGFPLLGDKKYGAKDDCENPFLYSAKIAFTYKNEEMIFENKPEWIKE